MAANPIQIVPLREDALAAPAAAPKLTYRGGPLLASVQVFSFFWGAAWQQDPESAFMQEMNQFFDYVVTSPLLDQLAEYSTPSFAIGHGIHSGSLLIADPAPAGSVTDADIQQFIRQQLSANAAVPPVKASSLYFVFLPPGVTVSMDGGASCSNFCGYHSDYDNHVFYAVMPYPDCSGCTGSLAVRDALTSTTSHELCEAITDPIPGQGWYDDQNGEIGDICAWKMKTIGGYAVQLEWSNSAGRCV